MNRAATLALRDTQRDAFARRLAAREPRLIAARHSLADAWNRAVADEEAAEQFAQASLAVADCVADARARDWLLTTAEPWARLLLEETAPSVASAADESLVERLLSRGVKGERRRRGVFFTPPELVRFIVRGVDDLLREEFGYADGLATDAAELRLLDPACGSGFFLEEVLRVIATRRTGDAAFAARLLPRIAGCELLPGACLVARLQLATWFLAQGVDPARHAPPRIVLGNALDGPERQPLLAERFSVVLGNPPYRGLSENHSPWIRGLIEDYKHIDGEPLRERKHWLHDDYVKFLRLAQDCIERSGRGLVAFVTNHGFQDNAGFRGMRRSLMHALPRIAVVDLHGNQKAGETTPAGGRDENVFGIEQGTAVAFLRRNELPPQVTRADVWGLRTEKNALLAKARWDAASQPLTPQPPQYAFQPRRVSAASSDAWRLCDAMPANTTAPVTARDAFVIAFTRDELAARLTEFCDLSISDDAIRAKYFQTTRSHRYAAGDTRGWKLAEVRRKLAAEADPLACLRPCLYRPFDVRWIAWRSELIDWPRPEITRHLLDPELIAAGQLCLIARRQSPPGRPPTYFLASNLLAIDGVIRSDNRGSESLFPLFTRAADGAVQPNFAPAFRAAVAERVGREVAPRQLAEYLYGLWHSPGYRRDFAAELCVDFPRIPLPKDAAAFAECAAIGARLLAVHRTPVTETSGAATDLRVAPRYPRFEDGAVLLAPQTTIAETTSAAWNYRLGSYQVLYKYLADRRGRRLTTADVASYRQIIIAVEDLATVTAGGRGE